MKLRKFYPRQILHALKGRETPGLSLGRAVIDHMPPEERHALLLNINTRIFLKIAPGLAGANKSEIQKR